MERDFVNIIEAAYAEEKSEEDWMRGVAQAAAPVFDAGLGIAAFTFDLPDRRPLWRTFLTVGGDAEAIIRSNRGMHTDSPAEVIVNGFNENLCATLSGLLGDGLQRLPYIAPYLEMCGAVDSMGVVAYDPMGSGVCLGALLPEVRTLDPATQRTWLRIAAHLGAGFRLRQHDAPATADAVLDIGGKLYDAIGDARDREARTALRHAARAIDRARTRRNRDPEDAVAIWRALVSGRWSLVDRFESDGRHFLIARENKLETPPVRPLSERERQVVALAARGRSNKLIAYELGIAVGTVSTLLGRAAQKLGASSRTQLVTAWQRLAHEDNSD